LKLQNNVQLNQLNNVELLRIGIGNKQEIKTLAVRKYYPGSGSMEDYIKSGIMREKYKTFQVEVDTLDHCIEKKDLPKPDLIKIDIEGMEYNALLGMAETLNKHKPLLYIEIHGSNERNKIENIRKILSFIDSHDYSIYHVESKQKIKNDNYLMAKEGHIFCKTLKFSSSSDR